MAKNTRRYDLIASIGDTCATSLYLRRNKLQYASYPLDWVGYDPFLWKIDLLTHHFADFMNLEDFSPMERPKDGGDVNCDTYINTRTGCCFWHDFPIGIPIEQSYPSVKEKYRRRIKRLFDRINKSQDILFIWFSPQSNLEDSEIIAGQQKLAAYFAPRNINLLIIEDDKTTLEIKEQKLSDKISRIRYHMFSPTPKSIVSHVLGNVALGTEIFKRLQLKTPWWFAPAHKLIRCIPNQSLKKKLRKKLYNY